MLIGVLTSIAWIIVMLAVTTDVVAIQNSYLPSLELFYQATGSKAAATFMQAYLTMLYYSKVHKHSRGQRMNKLTLSQLVCRRNGSLAAASHGHFHAT